MYISKAVVVAMETVAEVAEVDQCLITLHKHTADNTDAHC